MGATVAAMRFCIKLFPRPDAKSEALHRSNYRFASALSQASTASRAASGISRCVTGTVT